MGAAFSELAVHTNSHLADPEASDAAKTSNQRPPGRWSWLNPFHPEVQRLQITELVLERITKPIRRRRHQFRRFTMKPCAEFRHDEYYTVPPLHKKRPKKPQPATTRSNPRLGEVAADKNPNLPLYDKN